MKLMIQPCVKLINEKVERDDFRELVEQCTMAGKEADICCRGLLDDWDNLDNRADLGRALAELIVWNLTLLKALEKADGTPKDFVPAVMAQVFYEHYAKGYHDSDFDLDIEED